MEQLKKYSPQFKHVNDAVAFVVHLSFLSKDCKLVGLSEEQYLDDIGSCPQGWNKSSELYQFRYILKKNGKKENQNNDEEKKQDEQQRNTTLVKILAMEDNELLVTAVKEGSNAVSTLEINLSDHIDTAKAAKDLNDYQSIFRDIDGLNILLNDQITQKVVPQNKQQKGGNNNEKKKGQKKKPDDNPSIFPEPNHPNNPLFIGGGRPGGGIPFGGGFGGDIDPFGGGGGNLMGPNQINQQWNNRNNPNNPNLKRPPKAKFDPFGPGGNFPNGPDPDHFKPPGRGPFGGGGGGGMGGGGMGGFGGII